MAIRFTPEYNERIRRIVKNYNARVRNAHKRGVPKSQLPNLVSVSGLKKSYSNRQALEDELNNLEIFGRKSTRVAEVKSETSFITNYELALLKQNRKEATKYYQNIIDVLTPKIKKGYLLETERIDLAKKYIELINAPEDSLSYDELKAAIAGVRKFRDSHAIRSSGYRGFLTVVDFAFDQTGVSQTEKDEFFKKLSVLDENEFFELYENNPVIERIFESADSPEYGPMKLNMTIDMTQDRVDYLLENIDSMIAEQIAKRKK